MKKSRNTELEEAKVAMKHLGHLYRRYRKEMDILEFNHAVQENYPTYSANADFVYRMDRNLRECSKDTRCIILNDYLLKSDPGWFTEYYSRSTYYRLKRKAVKEFVDCLNS